MRRIVLVLAIVAAVQAVRAQKRSGSLLVLNKDDAAMVFVDPGSGAVTGRVAVGDGPHELVVSTDGKFAFASNYGTNTAPGHTISMIDLGSKKELRRIDVSPLGRPHGLAFAGGKLYFTAEANKIVARYDPAADKIDWQFETGQNATHMVVVSKDLHTLFTSNISSGSISIISEGNDGVWAQTVVPVGKGPEGIALSPDGKTVWSARSQDGGVSIVDVALKKVAADINVGTKRSNRLKFTADGHSVVISDIEAGELVVLDPASRQVVKHVPLGKSPEGILVAPDGRLFVAVNGDNEIAVVNPKTWQVTSRIKPGTGPDGMAWLP
jgi:YVTN family beta-propeller protein